MSTAAPAVTAGAAATSSSDAASSASVSTYTHTTFLTTLTATFTQSLLDATTQLQSQLHAEQLADMVPEYYVEATKAALRAVLAKQYSPAIAQAYSAGWSNSAAMDAQPGTPKPEDPSTTVAASSTEKKKPIRTYIDGCFDIMHSGHYNAIRQAKALTDILVVGVHSDAEILRHKGPPVMNEQERLATVRACKWVDEVRQERHVQAEG
jgi:cytidyltransferase-like protein